MSPTPESKVPQLNIRPVPEQYKRLASWAAALSMTPPELARSILSDAIEKAYADHPELSAAHEALQKARTAVEGPAE
jgi:hypothetical protein